ARRDPARTTNMPELEVTWSRVISVWWLLAWRSVVGGVLLAFIFGCIIGVGAAFAGTTGPVVSVIAGLGGGIIGLCWAIAVVRMALRKHYGDFRVVLAPR